jgi:protein tyrosine phosphatase (PTP) superfamily phosphohydrolase (DUF442 family)
MNQSCRVIILWVGLVQTALFAAEEGISLEKKEPANFPGLPRVYSVSNRILTGYEPIGAKGFESLKSLGIKTIISVDGATPNLELAKFMGMRYVHIPFGYDEVPADAQKSIYQVLRELDGPFYFHCHHGQHRGPAAAAIALQIQSGCSGETALKVLENCGTGKDYKGLWKSVAEYQRPKGDEKFPALVEVAKVESMTQAMAKMDRTWDTLIRLQKSAWKPTSDHPDLSPEHEALMLGESLRTATRLNVVKDRQEDFWLRMKEAESNTFHLRDAIIAGDNAEAGKRFEAITKNCATCHTLYRNNTKQSAAK